MQLVQLEARRHGSGSRGRGDSRGRRAVSLCRSFAHKSINIDKSLC